MSTYLCVYLYVYMLWIPYEVLMSDIIHDEYHA